MAEEKNLKTIIATDCGSTTTKAILVEKQGDEYRLIKRGEAPTTVEAPFEDVTKGVLNAIDEVEDLTGRKFIDENGKLIKERKSDKEGMDIYVSTSSAGGGLQMMVAGVVKSMTAESAQRAALGAGAIVMDTIATNDGRMPYERIEIIRNLRPDMILLAGGVDGGTTKHIAELAEIIAGANPRPRLGIGYKLPLIYAGNVDARDLVKDTIKDKMEIEIVDNIRPTLEQENLGPASEKIHELFMEHVMQQAPGYPKLMDWADAPIMPTPGAVGTMMQTVSEEKDMTIVGVDIGGATTDIFSVFEIEDDEGEITKKFNRTVSANLGMSYSVSNVFTEAGMENVMRWVPIDMKEKDLRNIVKNKMIRPTTIPKALKSLIFEQGLAREALRLAFEHHKTLAVGLKGVQQQRTISDVFDQQESGQTLVNMMDLDMIIGSGGVLSHAPRRNQAAYMLMDAFLPEGITQLTVDSIFMMPQLGVLSQVHKKAATQVFERDCLIYLGTSIVPVGNAKRYGKKAMEVTIEYPLAREEFEEKYKNENLPYDISEIMNNKTIKKTVNYGEIFRVPLKREEEAVVTINPTKRFDIGEGKGNKRKIRVTGGTAGLIFDARGRKPFNLPQDKKERLEKLIEWSQAMNAYPLERLNIEK
ncbi:MAG: methylaspartate mutase [Candidatus Mcinerneyibacterium aminivorans]|uniref:Methylaspartate mutase n=1 Tax=Candidatus Mcinerneyibacterium aminivorans TaxID=2703815 RepID=A0A5D0MII5_9BACT|nr:MAG: methylaspartate mutase [Candidatus Mcinerneyibacterium aminivorans]